jgi:putative transposase
MSNVALLNPVLSATLNTALAKQDIAVSRWVAASEAQREKARVKWAAVALVINEVSSGLYKSLSGAADGLILRATHKPTAYPELHIGAHGKLLSRASLINYCTKADGDIANLLPKHKGSRPTQYEWELRAVRLYAHETTSANRPDCGSVAYQLQREGWGKIKPAVVRSVINRYSKRITEYSNKRVGAHYYNQNHGAHVIRDTSVLPVGFCYMGDGHMCDVYVAHPSNGHSWRPEITVWIDWRSNYIVGWFISNAESAVTTLHSLSQTFAKHNHVPARLYVDPGSGFKNKMITDGVNSFCDRYSISDKFALPGNAKGKGLVEGWFKHFEFKCGKSFETYCGHERTDRALSNMKAKIKRGDIVLPSLEEYKGEIEYYVDWYNNNPQKRLGCAPSDLWETLEPIAPVHSLEQMAKPVYDAVVRNHMLTFKKRKYLSPLLQHFTGETVSIEVDLNDDRVVTVRDGKGKYICEAHLVERKAAVAASIIEEENRQRLEGQIKRLEVHKQDAIEKARPVIPAQSVLDDELFLDSQSMVIEHDHDTHTNEVPFNVEDIFNV